MWNLHLSRPNVVRRLPPGAGEHTDADLQQGGARGCYPGVGYKQAFVASQD